MLRNFIWTLLQSKIYQNSYAWGKKLTLGTQQTKRRNLSLAVKGKPVGKGEGARKKTGLTLSYRGKAEKRPRAGSGHRVYKWLWKPHAQTIKSVILPLPDKCSYLVISLLSVLVFCLSPWNIFWCLSCLPLSFPKSFLWFYSGSGF